MMNLDYFSTLSEEQNDTIENIIQLDDEITNERDKDEKKRKEKMANKERIKLLFPNAHHTYHFLAVKNKTSADNFRSTWQEKSLQIDLSEDIKEWGLDGLLQDNLLYPAINLSLLPAYSFILRFTFTLEKPYISRDEQEFHIIDNPIRKDRVFGLPYVAPSSWKGSLRAALWQLEHKAEDDEMRRIFGNERAAMEQKKLRAGRLHLFPTFFTKKSLEIINPHKRERRVGTGPILMESVPIGTSGLFTILYVPFDLVGKEEKRIKEQVAVDIKLICKGLEAMFTDYGFGAKTSSGFGIAKPNLADGAITLKVHDIETSQKEIDKTQPPEDFKEFLNEDGSVREIFRGSGKAGLLSDNEYGKKKEKLSDVSGRKFKRFRRWCDENKEQWQKYLKSRDAPASEWPIWTFTDFEELVKLADQIESSLNQQEESQ